MVRLHHFHKNANTCLFFVVTELLEHYKTYRYTGQSGLTALFLSLGWKKAFISHLDKRLTLYSYVYHSPLFINSSSPLKDSYLSREKNTCIG